MLNCKEALEMIHQKHTNEALAQHIKICDACRLQYLNSSIVQLNTPIVSNKLDIIHAAQLESVTIIKRNKIIQNILFITFALSWMIIIGLLMTKYSNFTFLYFSISYLVLPFAIIHSKRKEIFQ